MSPKVIKLVCVAVSAALFGLARTEDLALYAAVLDAVAALIAGGSLIRRPGDKAAS